MLLSLVEMLAKSLLSQTLTQSQTDELIATTLDKYETELMNQTILDIPIYQAFLNGKYKKAVSGGHRIRFPFVKDKNDSFGWWGLNDTFNPQPKDILGWGYATLKQGAGDVTIEDLLTWMNSGEGKFEDIMQAKMDSLTQATKETLNVVAWGDGTDSAKEPTGITGHIPSSPTTGTYMGFPRSTNYWARVWFDDGETVGPHSLDNPVSGATPQAVGKIGDISEKYAYIIDKLDECFEGCAKNESPSDLMLLTDLQTLLWYKMIPTRCQTDIGIKSNGNFDVGYEVPHFRGIPIISDTVEMGAVSGEMRMINLKYYRLYYDKDHMFKWVGPRSPYNALRRAWYLVVRFQWVCLMPRKMGYETGISTWAS